MPRKKKNRYNDNNLAVAYYRYSSSSQKEDSIEIQQSVVRLYAQAHGLELIREYKDPASSGWKDPEKRFDYQRMIAEIETLRPNTILLYKDNRLGRQMLDNLDFRLLAERTGCKIAYARGSAPDLESFMGWFQALMEDAQAQKYSDDLSDAITDGIQQAAKQGNYCGRKILGYRGIADHPYEIDPDTAPIVLRIFADYADGKPMADIAQELNAEGRRTSQGNKFTVNGLRSILKNDAYIGVYEYAGQRIPDGMPKLIDKELFAKVQRKFAENKRQGSRKANRVQPEDAPRFWLTGKLFCGHCGESMQGTSGTSKTAGRKHYYYQCNGRRGKRRNGCTKKNLRKDVIEATVIRLLSGLLQDTELLAEIAYEASERSKARNKGEDGYLKGMEHELTVVTKEIDNLIGALKEGIWSKTTKAELAALEDRKEALESAIDSERARLALSSDPDKFGELFGRYARANLDDPLVRDEILEYFVDRIYVFDDKLLITGWFADEDRNAGRYEQTYELGGYGVEFKPPGFEPFAPSSTNTNLAGPHKVLRVFLLLDRLKEDRTSKSFPQFTIKRSVNLWTNRVNNSLFQAKVGFASAASVGIPHFARLKLGVYAQQYLNIQKVSVWNHCEAV